MNDSAIEQTVLQCLSENYGLSGTLSRLSGENLNYLLHGDSGERLVVKIVDDDMPEPVVRMESEAIKYAGKAGFRLKLPGIIENLHKKIETGIEIRKKAHNRLRVIEFIEGIEIEKLSDISTNLLETIGKTIAEFNLAMQGFDHPAAHRDHRWNLATAGRHRDKVSLLEDPRKRSLLEWGFSRWEKVESNLGELPWQYIHGDLNRENILVLDGRINGLVDFGDSCMNPTVCDLAIATAYFMMDRDDPMQAAHALTRGYEKIRALQQAEKAALVPLVCGRLAVSIAVSQERRRIDDSNPNWFSSEPPAWRLLGQLKSLAEAGISVQ